MRTLHILLFSIVVFLINNIQAQDKKILSFFNSLENSQFIVEYDSIAKNIQTNARFVKSKSYMYDSVTLRNYITQYNQNIYQLQSLLKSYIDTVYGISKIHRKLLFGDLYNKMFTNELQSLATNYDMTMNQAYANLELKKEYEDYATSAFPFIKIIGNIFLKTFDWIQSHKKVLNQIKQERMMLIYESHKIKSWDKL